MDKWSSSSKRGAFVMAGFALGLVSAPASSQGLLIAPSAIVIESRSNAGAVTLLNTSDRSLEATLSTGYGYPVTDSAGTMFLQTFDTIADTMPSAVNWIEIYPQRLVLPPGGRRTVRLIMNAPTGLSEGEYWLRLIVTSREGSVAALGKEIDSGMADDRKVSVGLTLEVRTVLGLFYRVGKVHTGITLSMCTAALVRDAIVAHATMVRSGNAAFVGSLHLQLRDSTGTLQRERSLPLGVYYTLSPSVSLDATGLAPGPYTLLIEAVSSRPDVADRLLLPIVPVRSTVDIRIP